MPPLIRFVPRREEERNERCAHCDASIVERWNPERELCASCALESELFQREDRQERRATRVER